MSRRIAAVMVMADLCCTAAAASATFRRTRTPRQAHCSATVATSKRRIAHRRSRHLRCTERAAAASACGSAASGSASLATNLASVLVRGRNGSSFAVWTAGCRLRRCTLSTGKPKGTGDACTRLRLRGGVTASAVDCAAHSRSCTACAGAAGGGGIACGSVPSPRAASKRACTRRLPARACRASRLARSSSSRAASRACAAATLRARSARRRACRQRQQHCSRVAACPTR